MKSAVSEMLQRINCKAGPIKDNRKLLTYQRYSLILRDPRWLFPEFDAQYRNETKKALVLKQSGDDFDPQTYSP